MRVVGSHNNGCKDTKKNNTRRKKCGSAVHFFHWDSVPFKKKYVLLPKQPKGYYYG